MDLDTLSTKITAVHLAKLAYVYAAVLAGPGTAAS
jgi:hypothetical protein